MQAPILALQQVSKSFGGVCANRAVTLAVERGSITGPAELAEGACRPICALGREASAGPTATTP